MALHIQQRKTWFQRLKRKISPITIPQINNSIDLHYVDTMSEDWIPDPDQNRLMIQTLDTVKKQYRNQLLKFVESATLKEINQLSNAIHQGASTRQCGLWSKKQNTFTSCENENCQMLAECLEIIATLPEPEGRPQLFECHFDGNTDEEREKQAKRQIRQQYAKNLPASLTHEEHCQIEQALLFIPNSAWSTLSELSDQVERHIKNRTTDF